MDRAATAIGFLLILVFLNCRYTLAFFAIISVLVEFLSMIIRIVSRRLISVFQNYLKQFPTVALIGPHHIGKPRLRTSCALHYSSLTRCRDALRQDAKGQKKTSPQTGNERLVEWIAPLIKFPLRQDAKGKRRLSG